MLSGAEIHRISHELKAVADQVHAEALALKPLADLEI